MSKIFSKIKLPFKSKSIKGDGGVILIIGGSSLYVGAPYFAAKAAFKSGSDLVYIFTCEDSILPIKSLLPEAIVLTLSYEEWILNKIKSCIIGSGLGIVNDPQLKIIEKIVNFFNSKNIPIILDGDGLRLYNLDFFKNYSNLMLTPNIKEAKKTVWLRNSHILLEKGKEDVIRYQSLKRNVLEPGSIRRCCGLGDILVGILASFLYWQSKDIESDVLDYVEGACILIRKATKLAEQSSGISLMASDVIDSLKDVYKQLKFENE